MAFYSTKSRSTATGSSYSTSDTMLAAFSAPKVPKAPIHNPYDKFTKPQFDDFINDITGTLRRALSHREIRPARTSKFLLLDDNARVPDDIPITDDEQEDSSSELQARRTVSKGKGRDPREGPGLGAGSSTEPIDLADSDSELGEEEAGSSAAEEYTDENAEEEDEEEEDEAEEQGEEEEGETEQEEWNLAGTSSSHQPQVEHEQLEEEEDPAFFEENSDSEEEVLSSDDHGPQVNGVAYSTDEYSDEEQLGTAQLLSDGHHRQQEGILEDDQREYLEDEQEEYLEDEQSPDQPVEIADPWVGPRTYAEDFYSGEDQLEDAGLFSSQAIAPQFEATDADFGLERDGQFTNDLSYPHVYDDASQHAPAPGSSSVPAAIILDWEDHIEEIPGQSYSRLSPTEIVEADDDELVYQERDEEEQEDFDADLFGSDPAGPEIVEVIDVEDEDSDATSRESLTPAPDSQLAAIQAEDDSEVDEEDELLGEVDPEFEYRVIDAQSSPAHQNSSGSISPTPERDVVDTDDVLNPNLPPNEPEVEEQHVDYHSPPLAFSDEREASVSPPGSQEQEESEQEAEVFRKVQVEDLRCETEASEPERHEEEEPEIQPGAELETEAIRVVEDEAEFQRLAAEEDAQRVAEQEEARRKEQAAAETLRLEQEAEAQRLEQAKILEQQEIQRAAVELEAQRLEEQKEAERRAAEELRLAQEKEAAEALRRAQEEEERRLQEKRRAEEEKLRLAKEEEERQLQEKRRQAEEEKVRLAKEEEERQLQEKRRAEEEKVRLAREEEERQLQEKKRQAEEEKVRLAKEEEERRAREAEELRVKEEKQRAREEEERRIREQEELRAKEEEQRRVQEEKRRAREEEQRRAREEELRRAREAEAAETQRLKEEEDRRLAFLAEQEKRRLAEEEQAAREEEARQLAAEKARALRQAEEEAEARRLLEEQEAERLRLAKEAEQAAAEEARRVEEEATAKRLLEQKRIAAQEAENRRLAEEEAQAQRKRDQEAQRLAAEQAEKARRLAAEQAEAQRKRDQEAQRLAAEQAEKARRLAAEEAEAQRKRDQEAQRLAAEQAEKARRLAAEEAEAQQKRDQEAQRLAAEQAEKARHLAEQAAAEAARLEEQEKAQRLLEAQTAQKAADELRLAQEQELALKVAQEEAEAQRKTEALFSVNGQRSSNNEGPEIGTMDDLLRFVMSDRLPNDNLDTFVSTISAPGLTASIQDEEPDPDDDDVLNFLQLDPPDDLETRSFLETAGRSGPQVGEDADDCDPDELQTFLQAEEQDLGATDAEMEAFLGKVRPDLSPQQLVKDEEVDKVDPETEVDPFKLMGSKSTVAPGPVATPSNDSDQGPVSPLTNGSSSRVKRRRELSPRRTRSKTVGNGHKANGSRTKRTNSVVSTDSASSSGASSAAKLLITGRTAKSRSPSVASSRGPVTAPIEQQPLAPSPFIHDHSRQRGNNHAPPIMRPPQPSKMPSIPKPPIASSSNVQTNSGSSQNVASSQPAIQAKPAPSPRLTQVTTDSPRAVTRSQCRFHRISLPRDDEEEDSPRLFFLVPGCSLVDRELMEEEEIEDHGDANSEDRARMVENNIESLDFNPNLIGILRQLVGVDLLREQEIFYLPQPGEEPIKEKHPRRKSAVSRMASRGDDMGSLPSSPIRSPISSRAPASIAGSTASARLKTEYDNHSMLSYSQTSADESSDHEGSRQSKKPRLSPVTEQASVAESSSQGISSKKRKRLGADAAEYRPGDDHDDQEVSDPENVRRRGKKLRSSQKHLKRSRTTETKV
ncbi:hypothetical protein C8J56DRAFT_1161464 [Mycena floridula]|nr:hypothetical protein C8J56DRAFT_1161464 [Mycena floridula]